MIVGTHYYIGLSQCTNQLGAQHVINILKQYNLSRSVVRQDNVLHLKTGLAYLEHNNLIACGEFLTKTDFHDFNILEVSPEESYAANCI